MLVSVSFSIIDGVMELISLSHTHYVLYGVQALHWPQCKNLLFTRGHTFVRLPPCVSSTSYTNLLSDLPSRIFSLLCSMPVKFGKSVS